MAALTLSEKEAMISKPQFLERLKEAILVKAHYWDTLITPNAEDYNLANQKRKRFAKLLLNGQFPTLSTYAEFFLFLYDTASPDLISGGDLNGELTDAALVLNTYADPTYDHFAETTANDLDEPIIW